MKLWNINANAPSQELDKALKSIVMNNMRAAAPILEYAEFYTFKGEADKVYPKSNTTVGQFRALNNSVTPQTTDLGTPKTIDWKILSDAVRTDRALIDRGVVVSDEHIRSLTEAALSLGRYFTDQLINGTGTGETITGLKSLITGSQSVVFDTADGGVIPFGDTEANKAQQLKFLEQLNKIIYSMNPTCLIMNSALISRLETIAMGFLRVDNIKNAVGANQRILSYKGVPIVDAGYKKDDSTPVIDNAETVGTNNDATSLYAVKFGERKDTTLNTTETGLKVIHNPKKDNFVQTDIELQYNLNVINVKSAVRLRGLRVI